MPAASQNGWRALTAGQTRRWKITGRGGKVVAELPLHPDHAGFVLAWFALWFHEVIERLDQRLLDDWGYAHRPVRGSTTVLSNHASATAADLNATRHPQHVPVDRTFTARQQRKIRTKLRTLFGVLAWGGNWSDPDGMHFEISAGPDRVRIMARYLALTARGRRIRKANPGYRR